jgi:hypothetical protein
MYEKKQPHFNVEALRELPAILGEYFLHMTSLLFSSSPFFFGRGGKKQNMPPTE